MKDRIDIKGIKITDIVKWYLEDRIWVDRKYQRKLVWDISDKKLFIKSLFESIPVPAVIYAQREDENGNTRYEIIDGLQRTNAIVSFMMGEYYVEINGSVGYFDPEQCHYTFGAMKDGKYPHNEELLPGETCYEFAGIEIPVIIIPQDDIKIETIFNRINSTGKKLTPQDIRQSLSHNRYSELVRELSTSIRGDYTYTDLINLSDMPKISFGYGLKPEETFWIRNRIFEAFRLKDSKDEEIIAKIIIGILLENYDASPEVLDAVYKETSTNNQRIISKIDEYGNGNELLEILAGVGEVVKHVYDVGGMDFDSTYYTKNEKKYRVLFSALFYAGAEGVDIDKYESYATSVINTLNVIDIETLTMDGWKVAISTVCDVIKKKGEYIPTAITSIARNISMRLSESAYESQMTEYKLGFTQLGKDHPYISSDGSPNRTIERIGLTLSAMTNTHSMGQQGCVIIGVADSEKQAKDWKKCYSEDYVIYKDHYITGVESEIEHCFENADAYQRFVVEELRKCFIDKDLLEYVEQNIRFVDLLSKQLLIIPVPTLNKEVKYGKRGDIFYRSGASNKKRIR